MATNKNATPEIAAGLSPAPLWRNRSYLLLWGGQAASSLGSEASQLALPLLILSVTQSPAQAGIAGALIDRWDRKRTMILCDAGRALALGSIPLALALGRLTIAQLYLVSLVEGTLYVFFSLAETAALPHVVAKAQLPAATAQGEVTGGMVTLAGPALGGALFGVTRALPFLADAISYAASVLSLAWIRLPLQRERTVQMRSLGEEMREGLTWLWREPVVRALALLHSGLVLAVAGMSLLLVVTARQQHASPFVIGLMFGLGGVGSILGALVGTQAHKHLRLGQIMVAAFWLFAALWPLYAVAPSPLALGAILAAFWVVDETYDVAQISYRLALIPDAMRGRVTGAIRLAVFSADALGIALTGLLLQRLGAVATVLCFEVALVLLAVVATFNRGMRTARPLADL